MQKFFLYAAAFVTAITLVACNNKPAEQPASTASPVANVAQNSATSTEATETAPTEQNTTTDSATPDANNTDTTQDAENTNTTATETTETNSAPQQPSADRAVVLVYDASGSMWAKMGNSTRVATARKVLGDFFNQHNPNTPLGIVAYGHNRKGDCNDIEIIAAVEKQQSDLAAKLNAIEPKGKTPLSDALRLAAKQIPKTAEEADIVLITDGLETCNADPCAVANELANEGIKIRAHVVGFGMHAADTQQLACIAQRTGGKLLNAKDGADLSSALEQTTKTPQESAPKTHPLKISLTEKEGVSIRVPNVATITATDANGKTQTLGKTELRNLKTALPEGKWKLTASTDNGWTGEMSVTLPRDSDILYLPLAPMAGDMTIHEQLGDYQAGVTAVFLYDIQSIPGDGALVFAILPVGVDDLYGEGVVYSYISDKAGKAAKTMDLPKKPGQYKAVITYQGKYDPMAEIPITIAVNPDVSLTVKNATVTPGNTLFFTAKGSQNYTDLIEIRQGDNVIESKWYFDTIKANQPQVTVPLVDGDYQLVYVRRNVDDSKTDAAKVAFRVGQAQLSSMKMFNMQVGAMHLVADNSSAKRQRNKSHSPAAVGSKKITFTLPPNQPMPPSVTWSAAPHPDTPPHLLDAWAPHDTSTTIQTELTHGRWTVTATGIAETEYRSELNVTDAWENGLTIIIPRNNTAGGEGVETHPSISKATDTLIASLKATFIDIQTRQATAHVINEQKAQLAKFMRLAQNKLGASDHKDIANLLELMGQRFSKSLTTWKAAKSTLIRRTTVGHKHKHHTAPTKIGGHSIAMMCNTHPSCRYDNPKFNLHLQVPKGWALSKPYFYKTAGGSKSSKATVIFIRQRDKAMVSLNFRQAGGECLNTRSGRLCYFKENRIGASDLGTIIVGAN